MGVHTIDEPKNADELERIERGTEKAESLLANSKNAVSWIRYGLKNRMRGARRGDSILMLDRESPDSDPQRVFRHTPVLVVEEEPNCVRVYYEDQSNSERKALSWPQFKKLAKLARLPETISKNTTRQLTDKQSSDLKDYWEQARGK